MAVEICQIGADTAQVDEPINRPKEMILRHMIFQQELVEQCRLRFLPWSHHRRSLPAVRRIESAVQASIKEEFFNKISPEQSLGDDSTNGGSGRFVSSAKWLWISAAKDIHDRDDRPHPYGKHLNRIFVSAQLSGKKI